MMWDSAFGEFILGGLSFSGIQVTLDVGTQ
jgi:hypothetical protein